MSDAQGRLVNEMHAHEMHAYETLAYEMHIREMYTRDIYAHRSMAFLDIDTWISDKFPNLEAIARQNRWRRDRGVNGIEFSYVPYKLRKGVEYAFPQVHFGDCHWYFLSQGSPYRTSYFEACRYRPRTRPHLPARVLQV